MAHRNTITRGEQRLTFVAIVVIAVVGLSLWLQTNRRLDQLPPKELLDRVRALEIHAGIDTPGNGSPPTD